MADNPLDSFTRLVKKGDAGGLQRLIASGWDVNTTNKHGWTPLMIVDGNTEIIRLLLAAGADVNAVNSFGISALAHAAQRGKIKAVELLLKAGASVEVSPYGCSLLTYTLTGDGREHPKILRMLREAGASELRGNTHLFSHPSGFGPVKDDGKPKFF